MYLKFSLWVTIYTRKVHQGQNNTKFELARVSEIQGKFNKSQRLLLIEWNPHSIKNNEKKRVRYCTIFSSQKTIRFRGTSRKTRREGGLSQKSRDKGRGWVDQIVTSESGLLLKLQRIWFLSVHLWPHDQLNGFLDCCEWTVIILTPLLEHWSVQSRSKVEPFYLGSVKCGEDFWSNLYFRRRRISFLQRARECLQFRWGYIPNTQRLDTPKTKGR